MNAADQMGVLTWKLREDASFHVLATWHRHLDPQPMRGRSWQLDERGNGKCNRCDAWPIASSLTHVAASNSESASARAKRLPWRISIRMMARYDGQRWGMTS